MSSINSTEIKNCIISNNTCYNMGYDGIKLTGYIENINIENNICYNNIRDGIDFAGQTCKDVYIHDNMLHDNTLLGIDFKQLNRNDYPIDDTKEKHFSNVYIINNNIRNNYSHGINMQLYYDDVSIKNIIIKNNNILMGDKLDSGSNGGIRIAPCVASFSNAILIENNIIDGNNYLNSHGMRFTSAQNIEIKNNYITKILSSGVYLDSNPNLFPQGISTIITNNLTISDNIIIADKENTFSVCINTDNSNSTSNIIIKNNRMKNSKNGYLIALNLYNNTTQDNKILINE